MSIAKKLFASVKPTLRNKDGYPAYARSAEEQYVQTLVTNTFGNTFYADQQSLLTEAEALHRDMAQSNPAFMAKALVYARNEGYMRLQPLFGLAVLSAYRPDLFAKVFHTFANLPELEARTAIFLDISGSMDGEYLQIGSVFALALYKKTQGNSLFWLFDTAVEDAMPSRRDSILSQADRIRARGGTDTGAPVRKLLAERRAVDQIVIITDEQQNGGSPFYEALRKYRAKVNPNAKAFVIDIAPYRSAMVPPQDLNTFYVYGWSDTVLSYIAQTAKGYGSMVERVAGMELEGSS